MNELTAIIVDDELNGRIVLSELLKTFCPHVKQLGMAKDVDEAYRLIIDLKPELVFLDIQMPNGTGFQLLQKFVPLPFQVIFVTSHHQYAINAIKFNALDYILKPIEIEELISSVERAFQHRDQNGKQQQQIVNLINMFDPEVEEKSMLLHQHDHVRLVKISQINFILGESNYSVIHTVSGEKFISSKNLKEIEEFLHFHKHFVRIHKGAIINASHIKQYSKTDPCIILMSDDTEFEVSRRKRQEVLDFLRNH